MKEGKEGRKKGCAVYTTRLYPPATRVDLINHCKWREVQTRSRLFSGGQRVGGDKENGKCVLG